MPLRALFRVLGAPRWSNEGVFLPKCLAVCPFQLVTPIPHTLCPGQKQLRWKEAPPVEALADLGLSPPPPSPTPQELFPSRNPNYFLNMHTLSCHRTFLLPGWGWGTLFCRCLPLPLLRSSFPVPLGCSSGPLSLFPILAWSLVCASSESSMSVHLVSALPALGSHLYLSILAPEI